MSNYRSNVVPGASEPERLAAMEAARQETLVKYLEKQIDIEKARKEKGVISSLRTKKEQIEGSDGTYRREKLSQKQEEATRIEGQKSGFEDKKRESLDPL